MSETAPSDEEKLGTSESCPNVVKQKMFEENHVNLIDKICIFLNLQ